MRRNRGRDFARTTNCLRAKSRRKSRSTKRYGGVVPEVASRNHLVHAPRLLERAVDDAQISLGEIDAFAATSGPGLASSLMIGASIAKGLALGFGKPYLAINHLEGHLLSPFFGERRSSRMFRSIVSGGHTLLVEVRGVDDYRMLGRTVDDAAGEAFDKVANCLGSVIPAGRRSNGARSMAIRRVSIFRAACWIRATTISASAD